MKLSSFVHWGEWYFILLSELFTFILIFPEEFTLTFEWFLFSWSEIKHNLLAAFLELEYSLLPGGMWWVMMCDQNSCAVKIAWSGWSSTHKTVLRYLNIFDLWQQKQETLRMNCSGKSTPLLVSACALTPYHAIYQSLYLQKPFSFNLAFIFRLAWWMAIKSLLLCFRCIIDIRSI